MNSDNSKHRHQLEEALQRTAKTLVRVVSLFMIMVTTVLVYVAFDWKKMDLFGSFGKAEEVKAPVAVADTVKKTAFWKAPGIAADTPEDVKYGRELIAHTSEYLGPNGKVAKLTNGMNCQNCHLDAGTKPFGNNYSAVASTYPKFRARSGTNETIVERVSDCFERSLNGIAPDSTSKEMKAIVAYIKWLGKEVPKGESPKGVGLVELTYMERPADPVNGKKIFDAKCVSCHMTNGEGQLNAEKTAYTFPPLWGEHSYNVGAGLFRLSRFAGYVKANMPLGATSENPQLSDEEAWDLAAFVNSQPRPEKNLSKDWPDISKKPVDHPFGPYVDGFNEAQHKFGPFGPIKKAADERKKKQEAQKAQKA
ncbi:MAG: c-type cytochrome [Bacteroidia bacterium]